MRALVGTDIGSYTFDASAKTITFIDCGTVKLEDIDSIVDVTLGKETFLTILVNSLLNDKIKI